MSDLSNPPRPKIAYRRYKAVIQGEVFLANFSPVAFVEIKRECLCVEPELVFSFVLFSRKIFVYDRNTEQAGTPMAVKGGKGWWQHWPFLFLPLRAS